MTRGKKDGNEPRLLPSSQLARLFAALTRRDYDVIGPTVRDGAIVLDRLQSPEQLPMGWTDEQSPGHYRLKLQQDEAYFAFTVGPQSWKKYLLPAELKLWSAEPRNGSFHILNNDTPSNQHLALVGVRPCDLAAITIQDRVLIEDRYIDSVYANRRRGAFIVVAQCTHAAPTCFCASLHLGPATEAGFDLSLTELLQPGNHHSFVIRAGSPRGAEVLAELETEPVSTGDLQLESEAIETARVEQVRTIDLSGLKELVHKRFDDDYWDKIAARCLTCGNCTMACPTCFCSTVEDTSDLCGTKAERWRRWDSCFTLRFSYIHGGSVRTSAKARYRQWLTHKLVSWVDQFGTPGCVGCGRCITWCPVGIDLTEVVHAIQEGKDNGNA
jgi:sulfhydrogenase subunit beta (sulfur reductase)